MKKEIDLRTPDRDVMARLVRIESKLVRGFEELGVNIDTTSDWLRVDDLQRVVYINTLGRSLAVLLTDMARNGATQIGKEYDIVHAGDLIGTIVFRKLV